jgi:glucose-6-phosphate dehydrogenase assembly protein OpcA
MNEFDAYEFDTSPHRFKVWLARRFKRGKRDTIDNLAKRIIADSRIPRQASKSMYEARMRQYGYPETDISVFLAAWQEMRNEQLESE